MRRWVLRTLASGAVGDHVVAPSGDLAVTAFPHSAAIAGARPLPSSLHT
jgi:hypothetical protein